ncbi:unnamed protein product [Rotaria sp. Silwood2]|nr:unnamed protein product [Rotaria sp. Silwood2]CAF3312145.1 unnamed protein product [Rotaria sp. Silwood2]CAF4308829.1 unnamed protein product [Rotaria sp. Silwood2]CAF4427380.1 unnamed protein product [Rotaria sp. Silwood2]
MSFLLFILFLTIASVVPQPIRFQSFEEFDSALAMSTAPVDKTTPSETMNPTTTAGKSTVLPKDVYQWLSSGFNVLISVVSSTGVVGTCWCGIKLVRNGCICKSTWFYPKSFAEYRRRQQEKIKNQLGMHNPAFKQPVLSSSLTSSSPPSPQFALPVHNA